MFDLSKIIKDFPIFESNPDLIYLDSAATTQRPNQVLDVVDSFYRKRNSSVSRGIYKLAEQATLEYAEVRKKVQSFINAPESSEIIFTKNATEGVNLVMRGWGEKFIKKGDKIAITIMEHHSNFVPWQQLAKRTGAKLEVVDITDDGELDLHDCEKKLKGAKIFAFSAASNVLGTINDTKKLCKMAHETGALAFVDGAQSVPSIPTDVRKLDCDFLVFSGHKMLAPFGVGIVYGKSELLEKMDPMLYGGDMIRKVTVKETEWNDLPYKFESGTPDVGAVLGLGAAIDYLNKIGMQEVVSHKRLITAHLIKRLSEIPELKILGPQNPEKRTSLASFTMKGIHPHDIAGMLSEDNIAVRSGHNCAMPLYTKFGLEAGTRASLYIYNKKEEIDRLVESLERIRKIFTK